MGGTDPAEIGIDQGIEPDSDRGAIARDGVGEPRRPVEGQAGKGRVLAGVHPDDRPRRAGLGVKVPDPPFSRASDTVSYPSTATATASAGSSGAGGSNWESQRGRAR